MNEIENEVLDLAKSIRDTLARGMKHSNARVERAAAELREIQNKSKEVTMNETTTSYTRRQPGDPEDFQG